MVKKIEILFQKFTWRRIDGVVFVKFIRREIGEIVRYLPDKKKTQFHMPLKLSLLCGSRPKSAMTSPQQFAHSTFQISSKSVHFRWSYSRTRENRFCSVEYFHNSPEAML